MRKTINLEEIERSNISKASSNRASHKVLPRNSRAFPKDFFEQSSTFIKRPKSLKCVGKNENSLFKIPKTYNQSIERRGIQQSVSTNNLHSSNQVKFSPLNDKISSIGKESPISIFENSISIYSNKRKQEGKNIFQNQSRRIFESGASKPPRSNPQIQNCQKSNFQLNNYYDKKDYNNNKENIVPNVEDNPYDKLYSPSKYIAKKKSSDQDTPIFKSQKLKKTSKLIQQPESDATTIKSKLDFNKTIKLKLNNSLELQHGGDILEQPQIQDTLTSLQFSTFGQPKKFEFLKQGGITKNKYLPQKQRETSKGVEEPLNIENINPGFLPSLTKF